MTMTQQQLQTPLLPWYIFEFCSVLPTLTVLESKLSSSLNVPPPLSGVKMKSKLAYRMPHTSDEAMQSNDKVKGYDEIRNEMYQIAEENARLKNKINATKDMLLTSSISANFFSATFTLPSYLFETKTSKRVASRKKDSRRRALIESEEQRVRNMKLVKEQLPLPKYEGSKPQSKTNPIEPIAYKQSKVHARGTPKVKLYYEDGVSFQHVDKIGSFNNLDFRYPRLNLAKTMI